MSRKLIAAFMVIAVFIAFAMPETASAAPVTTQPTGTVLGTGAAISGTNVGEVTMVSALGTVSYGTATTTGTFKTNSTPSGVKATVNFVSLNGTGTNGECTSWTGGVTVTFNVAGGLPWCLEATTASDEGKMRGGACSEASRSIKYALDFTSIGTCNYERTTAALGILVTDASGQAAQVSISEQVWNGVTGNPFGCPSSVKLSMTFNFTTSGSPIYVTP